MILRAGKPGIWSTLIAAFRDASAVVRQAPGLTVLTTALAFAEALSYEAFYAELEQGLPTALLMTADTVVVSLVVAPLSVATFRWVLLDERPGMAGLADKLDVLITFAAVMAAIYCVALAPLTLTEGVESEVAPGRFWSGCAISLLLTVLSVRLLFLQPAIATRSVLATIRATWDMTRGVFWKMLGALAVLLASTIAIAMTLATLGESAAPHAFAMIVASFNVLLSIVGSAIIARYYAWRFAQT